jgi:protoporphyrinogen oxidase
MGLRPRELQESVRDVCGRRQRSPGRRDAHDHVSGYVIERGPNTIQIKAPLLRLLDRLGMRDALQAAQPASRSRFVYRNRELLQVPLSGVGFARTPLLSMRAKPSPCRPRP